jgi:tetratricopeptide (TPR) repeat protein
MIQTSLPTAYSEYKSLLMRLHNLLAEEKGRSEEARNIRREMDMPERSLTDEEMDHLDGLSADLYMLQGKEIFEPGNVSGEELRAAWKEERWEEVLQLLRKNIPGLGEANRAYLRAIAYERLGDVDCAYLFMNHAASLAPDDVVIQYFCLEYLMKLKRFDTAVEKANAYIKNPAIASPLLILSAADDKTVRFDQHDEDIFALVA